MRPVRRSARVAASATDGGANGVVETGGNKGVPPEKPPPISRKRKAAPINTAPINTAPCFGCQVIVSDIVPHKEECPFAPHLPKKAKNDKNPPAEEPSKRDSSSADLKPEDQADSSADGDQNEKPAQESEAAGGRSPTAQPAADTEE